MPARGFGALQCAVAIQLRACERRFGREQHRLGRRTGVEPATRGGDRALALFDVGYGDRALCLGGDDREIATRGFAQQIEATRFAVDQGLAESSRRLGHS